MIWVEGPTEEICFPLIASTFQMIDDQSIGFASVFSTSEFSSKGGARKGALQVYELAGKRLAPLLKGMAFALDRETLADDAVDKLERSKRKLRFLPRRCLENYILVPGALAEILSRVDESEHSCESVNEWLLDHGGDQKYGAAQKWRNRLESLDWLKRVDAPKLLSDLFLALSETRVEYRKTRDTPAILGLILRDSPEHLEELRTFVAKIVEIANRDTAP